MAACDYTCAHCGAAISPSLTKLGKVSRHKRTYCSPSCNRAAKAGRPTKQRTSRRPMCSGVCPGCGEQFTRIKWGDDAGLYCSKACHGAMRTRLRLTKPIVATSHHGHCQSCGKHYTKKTALSKTCSDRCGRLITAIAVRKRHEPRPCRQCAALFTPEFRWGPPAVYCSTPCLEAGSSEARRKNKRIAKSRRRARTRGVEAQHIDPIKVFERDKWVCHICKCKTLKDKRGTLHGRAPELDHLVTIAEGGSHTWGNVACACRTCNGAKSSKSMGQLGFNMAA